MALNFPGVSGMGGFQSMPPMGPIGAQMTGPMSMMSPNPIMAQNKGMPSMMGMGTNPPSMGGMINGVSPQMGVQ